MKNSVLTAAILFIGLLVFPVSAAEKGGVFSVIKENDIAAVVELESWKAEAEGIPAEDPSGTKKSAYNRTKRLVDSWIDRKKLEVGRAAGGFLSPKADLSSDSISVFMKQANAALTAPSGGTSAGGGAAPGGAPTRGDGATTILLGIAKALNELIKKGKATSADVVNEQLELLRWKSWDEAAAE